MAARQKMHSNDAPRAATGVSRQPQMRRPSEAHHQTTVPHLAAELEQGQHTVLAQIHLQVREGQASR
mgnify:CR=1 FL=1